MKPPRALGLLDMTCIGVNAIIGSSIFLFPGRLAEYLGPASIVAFLVTGLLLLSVGLCFAEASTHYDRPGGPYLYATECFGETAGFGIGWMCWVTMIVSWSAVANAVAVYLAHFSPFFATPLGVKGTAAAVILVMGGINYRGVKLGAWTSNFFTAAKLVPLAVFVVLGLPQVQLARFTPFAPHGWAPLGKACFLAYFAFQGFETVPVPAGEVEQPQRNVPLALFFSLLLSSILYMLVQGVAVGVNPGLAGAERPLAASAALIMGGWGAAFIVAGAAVSMIGYNAGSALGGPRYLVALSEDRHFPVWLSVVHERFQTPHRCVALTTALSLAAALAVDFEKLVDFSNVVICAQFISTCLAVPLLRGRHPAAAGRFRLPGGWVLPLIGVGATIWLGLQGGFAQVWWSAGVLVLGFALRAALRAPRAAATAALPLLLLWLVLPARAQDSETPQARLSKKVSEESLGAFLKEVSREPHVAGSPAGERLARAIAAHFVSHGLLTRSPSYDVLLSYPEEAEVLLLRPSTATLTRLEGERLASLKGLTPQDRMPWNAYAASGDVTGRVVYANYGRPEDFAWLAASSVSLKGAVVLARYSEGYRGGKTLSAERAGAAAILFYSDPADDGYAQGDVLPQGPWGPPDHFQRGSNVYDFFVPGDPLTPGWASTPQARRIAPEDSRLLPKIPSVPLAYPEAARILEVLDGPAVPKGWQGALPFTYHVGPGAQVRVKVKNRPERRPIINVLGTLKGSEEPERLVILSSHHDAWTRGAVDDGIGTAVVLELSRVFGQLAVAGWRPRRTLVFASWDAEEYTLTGSTEWGEEQEAMLKKDAVALLNVDAYRWGREFTAIAVPSLKAAVAEALAAVPDPATGKPFPAPVVDIMGSGSDYTVFLNHLGVPCVETMFTGNGGVYHSLYDDAAWVERVDPGFKYLGALTRINGLLALRLADSPLLPFDYPEYARDVGKAIGALPKGLPEAEAADLKAAAQEWEKAAQRPATPQDGFKAPQLSCANGALMETERALLSQEGLPDRPWFKHLIYAPRPSYDAMALPGVTEALEAGDTALAASQARTLSEALRRAAAAGARAAACLK